MTSSVRLQLILDPPLQSAPRCLLNCQMRIKNTLAVMLGVKITKKIDAGN